MRPKFMYAKYFLSSKNWKHKYFISLSFYKAKLGGRVAQVMPENCPHSNSRAWKQISLKPMCNVMSMQIFHFPNEPPLSLSAVWLLRLSLSEGKHSPVLAHLQVKLIDHKFFPRTFLNGSACHWGGGHYVSELCGVLSGVHRPSMFQLRSWHCLVLVTDPCNELRSRGGCLDFCD